MRYLPIFVDLKGRRALVIGDGEVARRKAGALRRAGAEVVSAPGFAPALLDGVALAVGADAADADLAALAAAAQGRGIPVNIVDRPVLCSFITPAIVDRDPVVIAIGSGGAAPVLARLIRARIEALLPPALGRLAALVDGLKAELRARWPAPEARRRVIERMLGGRAADLVLAGDEAAGLHEMRCEIEDAAVTAPGIVHLVGAGPGAADLLTLRAHRLLGEADVIVHDRLVSDEVLDLARRDAERIYVGKARANHCMKQEEINALLIRLARAGKRVVRLKGGDPLVFGRGGEEAAALTQAGVAHEIVPGVTAALACAAGAGIPLTHRAVARSVTFVTGHTQDGVLDLDFDALAAVGGTLAVYMGVATLPELTAGLIAAGVPGTRPAALIERGGTPAQRVLTGTVGNLAALAPGWVHGGPVMVLIGEAVRERTTDRAAELAASWH
ncbi:MAG: uroporphyrinogen-III C-methyltransferase [Acetobacteraceae bacterium]|nr:uroporphyrinogen-III C-methyltransferase [Acetobacteraceae bacterium]